VSFDCSFSGVEAGIAQREDLVVGRSSESGAILRQMFFSPLVNGAFTHLGKCAMVAHAALLAERPMMPTRIGAIGKDWKRVLSYSTTKLLRGGENVMKRKTYLQGMSDVINTRTKVIQGSELPPGLQGRASRSAFARLEINLDEQMVKDSSILPI
jgi:hypothetical protein